MISSGLTIFVILILIIVTFGFYDYHIHKTIPIPKRIWTYVEDPDRIPKTAKMCMESWKKHHPSYEIIVLTRKTAKGYVRIPEEILSHPSFETEHFWEMVSLFTVAEHGGIWMSPSTLLYDRFENWLFPQKAEYSGFYQERLTPSNGIPVMDTSFMASKRGSEFITKWRDEFASIAQYITIEKYIASRKQMGVDLSPFSDPIQQAMLVAAQKVLQLDAYPRETLLLQSAEQGPLRHRMEAKGDAEKGLQMSCLYPTNRYKIMILREEEQKIMEQELDYSLSNDICKWVD
jgi:hypothetical protein